MPVVRFRYSWVKVAAICLLSTGSVSAQSFDSGQAAYAARDWQAAQEIWTEEAESGSAEALLGLGNIADFGLLDGPDPKAAFGYYRRAAEMGHAEAAFNVAVMYDSGVGAPLDRKAAAAWYAFAALDQFPRAGYNLGQIYASGDGVPKNAGLAKLWLDRAAQSIPAAADAVSSLEMPSVTTASAPEPLHMIALQTGETQEIRLAWLAAEGPSDARYRVELVNPDQIDAPADVTIAETELSAISLNLDTPLDEIAWRVTQISAGDYASSGWRMPDGSTREATPAISIRFEVFAEDRRARGYAERVGASLERSGAMISYEVSDVALEASSVAYGYVSDGQLAGSIADFLPGLANAEPVQVTDADIAPGEIRVRFVFDDG